MGTVEANPSSFELLQAARSEDLVYEQIDALAVLGEAERKIIDTLKQGGAHLLQGARGMGKSMLLRRAEVELDKELQQVRTLAVYVNFKTGTLLEGVKANERDAFQVWTALRILQALHEKLMQLNLLGPPGVEDPYQRIFGIGSSAKVKLYLQEKRQLLQSLATSTDKSELLTKLEPDFLIKENDTSFLLDTVQEVIDAVKLNRVIFLFDEAAHTFIPSQQEIFFEMFKLLHGGKIAVKAAVYPTVTSYGRNFEVGQDAIVISLDRFEPGTTGRATNRKLFRDLLDRRLPKTGSVRKRIFSSGNVLDLCIDLSTGNPRAFLHLLNRVLEIGFSERAVMLATQQFVDQELLPYHQNLAKRLPKYAHHVSVGLDLLRGYIISEIRAKNRREKKSNYQSAFFTTPRDVSPNLRLALDILCYSGVLTNKGTVKIAGGQTGLRYMVHLALLSTERAFSATGLEEAIAALSLTDYREFASDDPEMARFLDQLKDSDRCPKCSSALAPNARFCSDCGATVGGSTIIGKLLDEPIAELSISKRLKERLHPKFSTVGALVQASREEIMTIKYIKEVRSRMIKNAADEFISG
jgi:hypothetical protein